MNTMLCVNYISGKLGEKNIGGFPGGAVEKNPFANAEDARDVGSTAGSGRSPGVGNGSPLQYSCLENPMDRGARWSDCPSDCRVRHNWAHSTTTAMFFTISFSTSVPLCGRQGDAVSKKKVITLLPPLWWLCILLWGLMCPGSSGNGLYVVSQSHQVQRPNNYQQTIF